MASNNTRATQSSWKPVAFWMSVLGGLAAFVVQFMLLYLTGSRLDASSYLTMSSTTVSSMAFVALLFSLHYQRADFAATLKEHQRIALAHAEQIELTKHELEMQVLRRLEYFNSQYFRQVATRAWTGIRLFSREPTFRKKVLDFYDPCQHSSDYSIGHLTGMLDHGSAESWPSDQRLPFVAYESIEIVIDFFHEIGSLPGALDATIYKCNFDYYWWRPAISQVLDGLEDNNAAGRFDFVIAHRKKSFERLDDIFNFRINDPGAQAVIRGLLK